MIDVTGVRMYVTPEEICDFFEKNKEKFADSKVVIAENVNTDYAILLTDANDMAEFVVERGEKMVGCSYACENSTLIATYRRMLCTYLLPVIEDREAPPERNFSDYDIPDDLPPHVNLEEEIPDEDEEFLDMEDAVYEREDELFLATADYLSIIMGEGDGDGTAIIDTYGEEFVNDVTDHVLEYLSGEQSVVIYRPTIFEDDDGNPVLVEFPYTTE